MSMEHSQRYYHSGCQGSTHHLADRNGPKAFELLDELALKVLLLASALLAFKGPDPADERHRGFKPFDMELILQGDGDTVKRAKELSVRLEVVVQFFGSRHGEVKTNLEKNVTLICVQMLAETQRIRSS